MGIIYRDLQKPSANLSLLGLSPDPGLKFQLRNKRGKELRLPRGRATWKKKVGSYWSESGDENLATGRQLTELELFTSVKRCDSQLFTGVGLTRQRAAKVQR